MTNSQRLFAEIGQQLATLRVDISQSGKRGLTDIHKSCENFVKHLLNRIYGYQLINLNGQVTNFEGLDIGDDQRGIAYQVSSERTTAKVDDMLTLVLRHRHYEKYPTVRLFVLGEKQKTYSVNVQTEPFFSFNWKTDVTDFDDLLRVTQDLDVHQLTAVADFIKDELPYTIRLLRANEAPVDEKKKTLIDVGASLKSTSMAYYQHSILRLRLLGVSYSTAALYQALDKFYEGTKGNNLYLLNEVYQKEFTARQLDFYERPAAKNVPDYFTEGALRIAPNQVIVEMASYSAEKDKLTSLTAEIMALTSLLIFCQQYYGSKPLQVSLEFELASSNRLSLIPQNSALHLVNFSCWPVLNPSPLIVSQMLTDASNETLNGLYRQIIHGFVATGRGVGQPFADLDEKEQNKATDWFRAYFSLPLQDLDD